MAEAAPLLEAHGLRRDYRTGGGRRAAVVRAVDDVSLRVGAGETVGLVGESGCGKSTLGRMLLGLEPRDAGTVAFDGVPLDARAPRALRRKAQIVFQDPFSALNPRLAVGPAVAEVLGVHDLAAPAERPQVVAGLLERVGLPASVATRRPGELSGGQRQRVVIARALAVQPSFIVADEVVSALDVSVQAQVLNLFAQLQDDLGLAYLFISHDLSVIRHVSARVLVMYLGRVIEEGPTERLFRAPRHPYTRGLLDAVPSVDPDQRREEPTLRGDLPNPLDPPSGCAFHPRCPRATDLCRVERPVLAADGPGSVACHHPEPVGSVVAA